MIRVFLDANVLFSASSRPSNIADLVDRLLERGVAVTSELAVLEARININNKRPTWASDLEGLLQKVEAVPNFKFDLPVDLQEKDQPILCSAIASRCDLLVTGDRKHFGELFSQTVLGTRIESLVGLAQALDDLREKQ